MQKTLPKGWTMVKLGEVAQIVSGSTPSTSNPAYWGGDITWVTPADLSKLDTIEIEDSERKITAEGYQSCSTAILPVGTVLFSSRAPIGHLAIAGKKMCTNQGFKSLIPNENANSFYLYFILKHFKARLISLGSGATFKEISKTSVEKFEIPLPPLHTQRKIVEILEEADNLRKLRQQADEKMKDLIPSLFVEMFGDPVSNPKGWEMKKLGEVSNIRRGASPRPMGDPRYFGGTIPWIRISDIHRNGKFLNATEDHVTEEGARRSVYLKAGSLIMAMAASIGTPCFLAVDGCIHDGFVVFEELSQKLDKEFLYYFGSLAESVGKKIGIAG